MGTLPQEQLAQAYASAHVVLASTIQSQSQYGMVNNRIFEALSCGALVVSLWAAELAALQCPALLLIEENISLPDYMDAIINGNQAVVAELREAGRNWVLKQHTWGHRVVQILDFYHYQQRGEFAPPLTKVEVSTATASVCGTVWCERANCPKMLWLVSPHLQFHSDYTFAVRSIGRLHLCALFEIYVQIYNEEDSFFDTSAAVDLSAYEIMVAIVTPFDALDLAMRRLDVVHLPAAQVDLGGPRVQKRGCYVIGYDPALVLAYLNAQPVGEVGVHPLAFHHYDAIWYRSSFEIAKFAEIGVSFGEPSRMQQMFGIGVFPPAASASASMEDDPTQATKAHTPLADDAGTTKMTQGARVVVVCFYRHAQLCTRQIRESFVRKVHPHGRGEELSPYTLLGLGGQWRDWLQLADKTDGGLPFLSLKELPSVVHVRDGWSGDAVRIVQSAEFVVIMNPAGPDDQLDCTAPLPAATSPHVQNMNVVKQVLECQLSRMNERSNSGGAQATTEEVMWPLVAAAVSYTRIHLLHRSALLLDLVVAGDCSSWSEEFLAVNMVKVGMNRLLGLGSRLSTVQPRLLGAHDVDAKVRCESSPSDHGDEDEDNALFHSFVASHELSAQYDISAVRFALVELHFDEFVSGRDGEACIQQPDVLLSGPEDVENPSHDGNATVVVDGNRPGDIVCLMRPYRYVAVVLSTGPTTAPTDSWNYYSKYAMSSTICRAAVELSIQLRGNFFGDSFYSATVSIPTADLGRFSLVPRKWNNIWLDKHSIFVYNAHYC